MHTGRKVLLIEDSDIIADFLRDLLASNGFAVSCWENGAQAVRAAGNKVFDIIISDYDMPVMTGAEVTRHFRTRLPASIIIGVSSADRKEDFLSAGADAFLQKPYRQADLLDLINRQIAYSLLP